MLEKHFSVTLPELALVAVTRGAIGIGAGLLLADRLQPSRRKAVGRLLFVAGVLSTIPIALRLFGKDRRAADNNSLGSVTSKASLESKKEKMLLTSDSRLRLRDDLQGSN